MAKGWHEDKAWADRYMPRIKEILGRHLLEETSAVVDQTEAADLRVLKMRGLSIGVRVRGSAYLEKYANEFTVRGGRPSGTKSELSKIVDGWGDYLFYGFVSDEGEVLRWYIVDLQRFRATSIRHPEWLHDRHRIPNGDASSWFLAFDTRERLTSRCIKWRST